MVEAGADEVDEALLVDALAFGFEAMQPIIAVQEEMREAVGKPKREIEYAEIDEDLVAAVKERLGGRLPIIVAENTDA